MSIATAPKLTPEEKARIFKDITEKATVESAVEAHGIIGPDGEPVIMTEYSFRVKDELGNTYHFLYATIKPEDNPEIVKYWVNPKKNKNQLLK